MEVSDSGVRPCWEEVHKWQQREIDQSTTAAAPAAPAAHLVAVDAWRNGRVVVDVVRLGPDAVARGGEGSERHGGPGADIGRAPLEASAQRPPTATYRGMAAADPDEAGEARYNACSAALSEALPDP